MMRFLQRLSNVAECFVLAYPNAGLPNEMGEYDQPPKEFAEEVSLFAQGKLINLVGGCCGTSDTYIAELSEVMKAYKPRALPQKKQRIMRLSGLEQLVVDPEF